MLDAASLQIMSHAFAAIPEEMGILLVRSSLSPNVRERRDSSAALFDVHGEMVAQAAHIPVHLGAMPDAVRAVIALGPDPGDTFVLNDPFTGGTHLPDITMIHAIDFEGVVVGYTVVRAHHSDVGGVRPGSMPPHSTEIFQEGLVLPPVRWATAAGVRTDVERIVLANVRTPAMRRGDLAAQSAACARGADRYRELIVRYGFDYVQQAGRELLDYTERRVRGELVERIPRGRFAARDVMEGDGVEERDLPIVVTLERTDAGLTVDFTGTAPAAAGNINCPVAVARSAAFFVVRCLVAADIPANGGIARVIDVVAPEGTLVNAPWPRAVCAGNVETSQRITDTIWRAVAQIGDAPAQGQGTLNNLTLGGDGWSYYETMGGGQGASAAGPGPSGVHVGMSNTRNTPIEVVELEMPVRVRSYALRRNSGGAGHHRGGDGIVREYEALERLEASLITERRRHRPAGINGGGDGALGVNTVNGRPLGGRAALTMHPGDVLRVETPGGGGWGGAEE